MTSNKIAENGNENNAETSEIQDKVKKINEEYSKQIINLTEDNWLTRLVGKMEAKKVIRALRKDPFFKNKQIEVKTQFFIAIKVKDWQTVKTQRKEG